MKNLFKLGVLAIVLALSVFIVGCSSGSASSSAGTSTSAESSAGSASAASEKATIDVSKLTDGEYTVDVVLKASTGNWAIETPARFIVANGEKHAYIVWSSEGYEAMKVDGVEYYPVPRAGNTTFEIAFDKFDKEIPVSVTMAGEEGPAYEGSIVFDSSTVSR